MLDAPLASGDGVLGDLVEDYRPDSPVEAAHGAVLSDGYRYTLAECGRIFRVTRERIR